MISNGAYLRRLLDQLVVEAGRLAVLDEFEGTEIVLGRDDQTALLDLVHAGGARLRMPSHGTRPSAASAPSSTRREMRGDEAMS